MSARRQRQLIAVAALAWLLAAPAFVPGLAQEPPQAPSRPPQQQKADPGKKVDRRQGAQADQQPPGDRDNTIEIKTELVILDVSVIDQNNTPIYNLTKDDFAVYEDRVKQNIEGVIREEVPISLGLVIDTSGSMRAKLQAVSEAALGLIKQMRPDDEGFVSQFKTEAELVQDFTRDRHELEDALGELFTSGGTALLDAIIATSDYAQEKGKERRKALVVISDGLEKNSSIKEKEVLEAIKENEVQVYMIGFLDEEDSGGLFRRGSNKKAKELLARLAEDSGGRAFFPKDMSEMPAIAAQIAKDLRTQYVVSYYPSNERRDGTFRAVHVMVNPKGSRKLIARTRQGYFARTERGLAPAAGSRRPQ